MCTDFELVQEISDKNLSCEAFRRLGKTVLYRGVDVWYFYNMHSESISRVTHVPIFTMHNFVNN